MKCLLALGYEGIVKNESGKEPVVDVRWQRIAEILRRHFDVILLCSRNPDTQSTVLLNNYFSPDASEKTKSLTLINTMTSEMLAHDNSAYVPNIMNNADLLYAIIQRLKISPMRTVLASITPNDITIAGQRAIKHTVLFDSDNFDQSMSNVVFQCYKTIIDHTQWNNKDNSIVFFGTGAKHLHHKPTGIIRLREANNYDDLLATVNELLQANSIKLHPRILNLYQILRDDLTNIKSIIYPSGKEENHSPAQSAQHINTSFAPK